MPGRARSLRLGPEFREWFAREPEAAREAPGRVNLVGEHTDYNGGFVLPTVIPQTTLAEIAPRGDQIVRAASAQAEDGAIREYTLGAEARRGAWIDYVQGITAELVRLGFSLPGFDLAISSSVPVGSGLSSSAALEISVLRALRNLFGLPLDDVALALAGQRAENDLVGAPVGVMDQMASSLGSEGIALLLDTRTLENERIEIPRGGEIVVINSGVRHDHAAGDYRTRRAECEEAARRLGVAQLRDLPAERRDEIEALPEPLRRRARHVVTENARVLEAALALRARNLTRVGELFNESHDSQRDDFEVSVPAVDRIVSAARREEDVFGARLTGGGFGGSVVLLTRAGTGSAVGERVVEEVARQPGGAGARLVVPGRNGPF